MSSGEVLIVEPGGTLAGTIRVPGDKSISHRSVMFGQKRSAAPNVPKYRDFARNTLQDRGVSFSVASLPLLPLQSLSFPPCHASRTRVQSCRAAALRLMSFTACASSREETATCTQLNAIRQGSAAGVSQARECAGSLLPRGSQ